MKASDGCQSGVNLVEPSHAGLTVHSRQNSACAIQKRSRIQYYRIIVIITICDKCNTFHELNIHSFFIPFFPLSH